MYKNILSSFLLGSLLLLGCSSKQYPPGQGNNPNAGRYSHVKDSQPQRLPTLLEMTDPVPQPEPLSRGGNNPYTIFGQNYIPQHHLTEHKEAGIASWYGNKFHGHLTSNGETYNMFAMTAAHKTLPLPSYVKVTNLDNQQSAIVRVNDRGPFHRDRIIDLSYSAAHKLDMLKQGTARVQIELVQSPAMLSQQLPDAITQKTLAETLPVATNSNKSQSTCYIQVFASNDNAKLTTLQQQLHTELAMPSEIRAAEGIFRLLVGPTSSMQQAHNWLSQLKTGRYPEAYFFDSRQCS
ncbi:septal ring lytic transglycosylase RlpA family protein [Chromatiaceae bacterium AAb-1]|nr:septal ring lytic transglycosylase RlpA family protein [Chromatiaceae bacterium AAb-1]